MAHAAQRHDTHALLASRGVSRALFADPHSVTWLTGYAPPLQVGPTPFLGNPAFVWYREGHYTLLVQDAHLDDTTHLSDSDVAVTAYTGFTIDRPLAHTQNTLDALEDLFADDAPGQVGAERRVLSQPVWEAVRARFGDRITPLDDALVPLRMRKTDEELSALRAAFALTDLGHRAAREAVTAEAREIDVWAAVTGAVLRRAGRRLPMGNDCVVGRRDNNIGGWPRDHVVGPHGSLVVDLGVRWGGYWSDSCATLFAGAPTPRQDALYRTVEDALDRAIGLVRPGVRAGDLDRRVRGFIEGAGHPVYPHHTGHGVGVSLHEEPRIVPYNDIPLAAGMVIMLEPGIYYPGEIGVRLEEAVLVTEEGAEVLTRHLRPEASEG